MYIIVHDSRLFIFSPNYVIHTEKGPLNFEEHIHTYIYTYRYTHTQLRKSFKERSHKKEHGTTFNFLKTALL